MNNSFEKRLTRLEYLMWYLVVVYTGPYAIEGVKYGLLWLGLI
ncbi:hypothetical protein LCGC14_1130600 [marine sediment metagenome]|uniref:Uncharacterized protein n=1 Tax=marine sediment metagenome TaxID=412755 RepID=A0A0F9MNZ5_9ZZZZ